MIYTRASDFCLFFFLVSFGPGRPILKKWILRSSSWFFFLRNPNRGSIFLIKTILISGTACTQGGCVILHVIHSVKKFAFYGVLVCLSWSGFSTSWKVQTPTYTTADLVLTSSNKWWTVSCLSSRLENWTDRTNKSRCVCSASKK